MGDGQFGNLFKKTRGHDMKVLSIIPARGGSKGIHLKNLATINEKPMLFYTVNASLNSSIINKTIVSTDHKDIAETAKSLGAEVIIRPKKLANDSAALEPVMQHTLDYLKNKENYVPDIVILLQNTSPRRTSKHIDEALKLLRENNFDSILSGYATHSFLWKVEKKQAIPINYNPLQRPNKQEIKNRFIENGAIYATTLKAFQKNNCRISGKIGFYNMPEELSHQIDYPFELSIVEHLMKSKEKEQNLFSVKNLNIIITGSSGLLGSFYSRLLLSRGANVAMIDIDPKISNQIKEECKNLENKIKFYKCDLSKPSQIISTFKKITKDFKTIDVLINNAAFTSKQTFEIKDFKNYETHPFELWKKTFEVNIDAVHICIQQVLPLMKKQRNGSIINISSTYCVVGPDFDTYKNEKLWTPPGYAVTKSAILNLTRYVANLYGQYNIRCNSLTPSGVKTDVLTKSFIKKYSARNAFNRMGKTRDYARPIIFLCSEASEYMTGANLVVDAGWTSR